MARVAARSSRCGAVVGVVGEGEGGDGPEEWGGKKEEGDWVSPAFGAELIAAEEGYRDDGCGDGPEKRGLAVGVEDEPEAGEPALCGKVDGPVEVVMQACGGMDC
jgi:hypothetical protein